MKITVTQKDIAKGKRYDCGYCPTALAIQRASKNEDVAVMGMRCEIDGELFDLPEKAILFIHNFDLGKPVKPFSFEI